MKDGGFVPYAWKIKEWLSGLGNLIPYIGPFIAYGLTIGVCVATGKWSLLAIALCSVVILHMIDTHVINPRLLSQSIDIHPVMVIIALLFGSAIGGIGCMLLAVPVASFLKIQFERFVAWKSSASKTI
ncbi:MAG: AI-2E family transporter [Lachnospiraceae bacterium]|nr:AI-2E family transporter [Lachnospiraceae bacterium]